MVSRNGAPKRRKAPAHESGKPRTLASLALASGTGEDVAALSDRGPRPRFRLEGRALRAVLIACLAVLGAVWASLAFAQSDEPALRDESDIRQHVPLRQAREPPISRNRDLMKRRSSSTSPGT